MRLLGLATSLLPGLIAVRKRIPISNIRWAFHQPDDHATNGQRHHQAPDKKHQSNQQKVKYLNVAGKLRCCAARDDKPGQHRSQGRQQGSGDAHRWHQPQQTPLEPIGRLRKTREFVQPIHAVILQACPGLCWFWGKTHTCDWTIAMKPAADL